MREADKIAKDELEDALRAIDKRGLDRNEFGFTSIESIPLEVGPVTAEITVTRGKHSIKFRGGHGTSWPVDFEKALDEGLFG
jgi:hypothetical protein